MRFSFAMAWRETRAELRHVLTVLACVALGVAALVGVGSLAVELQRTLGREARTLLGGDVEVRSPRGTPSALVEAVRRLHDDGAALTHTRELVGMVRAPGGTSLLVELKAVDGAYPLYGVVDTRPGVPLGDLLGDNGAVVEDALLTRLGARPGDHLTLGDATVVVRGVLVREPDRPASLVSLGPRVLVSQATLDRSGLVAFGSRVRQRWLLRLPATIAPSTTRRFVSPPTTRRSRASSVSSTRWGRISGSWGS